MTRHSVGPGRFPLGVDPFLSGVGANVVANLVANAIETLAARVGRKAWVQTDDLGRLFYLLEAAFSDELPSVIHSELDREWRGNEAFIAAYERLSAGADPDTEFPALVRAIEPLVGPAGEESSRQVAERIARPLPYLLVEAKEGSERVLLELRRVENLLEAQHEETTARLERIETDVSQQAGPTLILASDWPSAAEDALRRAAAADPAGLAALNRALDGKERAQELARLVNKPRGWMSALAPEVWELIAILCEEEGLWNEARQAWLTARDRPGADFAGCSVRAAEAAAQAEDREAAVALLNAAREDQAEHPRVVFQDALLKDDPTETLAALDAIEGAEGELAAMVLVAKASTYLQLNDIEVARASLAAAAAAGAGNALAYRMTEKTVAVQEAIAHPHPSAPRVAELATESLELETELLRRRRYTQAAQVRVEASAFHGVIGDFDAARRLLAEAVETYKTEAAEPRLVLAMAAAHLREYGTVAALLRPEDDRARARYLRALLKTRLGDEEKREAAEELEGLLDNEHEQIRTLAALARLHLAGEAPGVEWSDRAAAAVAERDPAPAVVFKAFWLENNGRQAEAERELLAHSDEAWALAELLHLAARQNDWPKAARYADALSRHDTDWQSQLSAAEAFGMAGDTERAAREFARLAERDEVPTAVRAAAYRRLVQPALDADDHARALELVAAWLVVEPDDADAAWVMVLSLAMLGRDEDALRALKDRQLHPRQPAEYRMGSQLYISAAEPVEALQAVVTFADEHNPPSEELEAFVIVAALRAGSAIPPEMLQRVSIQRFVEMFPESERLQPRSFEDFKQYLEEDLAERAKHIETVEKNVVDEGDTASAVLAVVTGNDIGGLWARLSWGRGLPMGYGYAALEQLERQDARAALGGPVLWDGTSVFVVDHLLDELTDTIRTAFPNSSITQAALADMAEGARMLSLISPEGERHEVGYNLAEGRPEMREWDPAIAAANAVRANSGLDFANKLTAVPNADPDDPQPEDEHLDLTDSNAFRSFVATFSAARRLKSPIYSDDRNIRRLARTAGVPAFGTVAVLDALAEANYIAADARATARRTLLRGHALGVNPSAEELISFARETGWAMTREIMVAALDRGPWSSDPARTFQTWLEFLRQAHRAAPETLSLWLVRFLDASHRTRPAIPLAVQSQHLVTLSLVSVEPDAPGFVRALVRGLTLARQYFAEPLGDPAASGLVALVSMLGSGNYPGPREAVGAFAGRAWTMLSFEDQLRTLPLFL